MTDWLDDPRVTGPLDEARLLWIAVTGRHGPHVTPLAFDRQGDELWALTPRDSAKVRAMRRDPRVGILIHHRGRTVIGAGRARLVDPLAGRGLGSLLRPDLPLSALSYLARNERRVLGTLLDGPAPTLPFTRTAVRITLRRVAHLDTRRDIRTVRSTWGNWPEPSTLLTGDLPTTQPDLTGVPAQLRTLLGATTSAALGWHTADGPVALPARWSDGAITVPSGTFEIAGALLAGPACLTVQRSRARISSVRGLMLHGTGRARAGTARAIVQLDPERVTWWSGEDSGTVSRAGSTISSADLLETTLRGV